MLSLCQHIKIISKKMVNGHLYYANSSLADSHVIGAEWTGFPPVFTTPKAVNSKAAMKLLEAWKKYQPKVKGKIPVFGYDSKEMKLLSFDIPAGLQYKYDPSLLGYVSKASFRYAVVSSTNELEKRIRKLENTVNRIMAKCCPEAENKWNKSTPIS